MRLVAFLVLVGCGGVTAEQPLRVTLGMSRDQALAALESQKYCPKAGQPPARLETYPRCDRPGAEWGESWVTARYDGDRLVEVRRYERYSEDTRALARWNQLIADRGKISTESDEATRALRSRLLEPGTRSVKAFRVDHATVAGVYLLSPTPPEDASVLEILVHAPATASKLGTLDRALLPRFDMMLAPAQRATRAPTEVEQHLLRALEAERAAERADEPPRRPVGDFPSACGHGPCERGGREPLGFFE